eukprot:Selendium_serpulae@DN6144_c0_g1_i1.p1
MKWSPIETDPVTLTAYVHKLGGPKTMTCQDVLSTEDWAIDMLEGNLVGLLVLFPVDQFPLPPKKDGTDPKTHSELWYTKQTIDNACGTIAIMHVMANADVKLDEGILSKFFDQTKAMTPMERAKALESSGIEEAHDGAVKASSTKVPGKDDDCPHHYVAFIMKGGHIFEMDGRKDGPIDHGTGTNGFGKAAAAIIKREYLDKAPNANGFSLLALAN